jgi:hypothetical protein
MHKLVFLCLYVLSINSFAYSLNVGTYVPYAFEAQDENAGNTTTLALNPVFSVAGLFSTPWSFYFNPEIGYVHHRNTSDEIEKSTLLLLYSLTFPMNSSFILRSGLGTSWITTKSDGGVIYLNNGAGMSAFAKPDGSTTTYVSHLTFGAEMFVKSQQAIRFDLQVMAPIDSERRQYNYLLTFNFYR